MGAVEVTMNLAVLSKNILLYLFFELLYSYKIVLSPMLLPLSWIPCGKTDT